MELQPGEAVLTLSPHERAPFVPGEQPVLTTHRLLRLTPGGRVAQSLPLDEIAVCEITLRLLPVRALVRRLAGPIGLAAVPVLLMIGWTDRWGMPSSMEWAFDLTFLGAMLFACVTFAQAVRPRLSLTVTARSGAALVFPSRAESAGDLALLVYRVEAARQRRLATGEPPSDAPRPARAVMLFPEETPLPLSDEEVELLGGRRSLVLTSHRVRVYARSGDTFDVWSMPLEEVASIGLTPTGWGRLVQHPLALSLAYVGLGLSGAALPWLWSRTLFENPESVFTGPGFVLSTIVVLAGLAGAVWLPYLAAGIFARSSRGLTFTSTSGVRAELPTHATPEELAPLLRRIQAAWHARREARGVP